VIAAPHSGAGKTLITLGLLRALKEMKCDISSAKVGPDYIDVAFHSVACGVPCINLDIWAMGEKQIQGLAAQAQNLLLVEGVMGLFDGADDGYGSTADVAAALGLPVVLIVDARAQGASAAALLYGFKTFRSDIHLAGVIFNRVGSERHAALLKKAATKVALPVLGCLPRDERLHMPSRHLGLVQAAEYRDLEILISHAADVVKKHVDLAWLQSICAPVRGSDHRLAPLPPLGQRLAIARDEAFSFLYHHLLDGWYRLGAEITFFSPLADEAPLADADAIFLPGGYPELHAGRLAQNRHFIDGLQKAAKQALIYGECGGFMALGECLIDGDGVAHEMAGLLPVVKSFESRTRHLGYRKLTHESPLPWPKALRGHEFHYSTLISDDREESLFKATNAIDEPLLPMGYCKGRVMGSYAHVISGDEGCITWAS